MQSIHQQQTLSIVLLCSDPETGWKSPTGDIDVGAGFHLPQKKTKTTSRALMSRSNPSHSHTCERTIRSLVERSFFLSLIKAFSPLACSAMLISLHNETTPSKHDLFQSNNYRFHSPKVTSPSARKSRVQKQHLFYIHQLFSLRLLNGSPLLLVKSQCSFLPVCNKNI